jgi:hypothetical protein
VQRRQIGQFDESIPDSDIVDAVLNKPTKVRNMLSADQDNQTIEVEIGCVASPHGRQQVDVDRSLVIIICENRAQMYVAAAIGEETQLPWRGVQLVHDF